jgi:hypothetical protein
MCPVHWDHSDHGRSARYIKQDWEKSYRAAVLEFDRTRLPRRIEDAEAAILKRSRSLPKPLSNHRKERDAITRALHILSLLREAGQKHWPHAIAEKRPALDSTQN